MCSENRLPRTLYFSGDSPIARRAAKREREREEVFCLWVGVGSDGWSESLVLGSANLLRGPSFPAIAESLSPSSEGLGLMFEKLPGIHSFREDFKAF